MIKYSLLLFIRNLQRQKLFSAINLLGLTVSIISALIIYLYVRNEFSYDRFHENAGRIYRVNQTFIWGDRNDHQFGSTGPGVANAIKEELQEVELTTSIHTPGNFQISYSNEKNEVVAFEQENILAADSNFFRMFNFPPVLGEKKTPLIRANTMVMTQSTAKKYFAEQNPVGKLVRVGVGESQQTYEVTAVVNDLPKNSYIQFDVLLSMESFPQIRRLSWSWVWTQLETYILLAEQANPEHTKEKLARIPRKHAEQTLQRVMNMSFDDYIKSGKSWELFLQPLTSIHLPTEVVYNRINNETGNLKIVYALMGSGIFIILLSCINFMNLSTAQFTRRIKEASIRKVLGLGRAELSYTYFIEAFVFCSMALVLGLAFTQVLLPGFNLITGKSLQINLLTDPGLLLALASLVVFMSLVSGSYPALFLSAFQPVQALKGKLKAGSSGKTFRNGLVIFQFSLSIILLLCTAIVFQQLRFVSEKDLGFDKENLLVIKHAERVADGETLANAAMGIPGVITTSLCTSLPPLVYGGDKFSAEGMSNSTFPLNFTTSDEKFIPALDIQLKFGRNFMKENPGDIHRVILNEMAIKRIGWTVDESVIGKRIESPGGEIQFEIVGVVADFNYWTLEAPIEPFAIFHIKNQELGGAGESEFVVMKVAGQNREGWNDTFAALEVLWKKHAGDTPLQYEFVDDAFASTFSTQQNFGNSLTLMAALAMLIAGLGLLGMIIYTLEHRTKEIGIRKVSGASTWNILTLISGSYTKLIFIAFLLGAPLSYWIMQQWLEDFAFRITPSPILFCVVGFGVLLIAMLITGYHSFKAALKNPVDVLKDE